MEESSSTTSRKCQKEISYCCVPDCKSAFYDKISEKTNLYLQFLNECWSMFVGKGAQRFFWCKKNPNKRICVWEFHFKDEDLTTTLGRGKKS